MEKTTTDTRDRAVPTEEFREHVQELIRDVEEPWRNDGLVAYVYHQTDLELEAAADLLETSASVLYQQSKAMRYRHYYRDLDLSTSCDDPLDDPALLERLYVKEGLPVEVIRALFRRPHDEVSGALMEHGLLMQAANTRPSGPFRVENLAENQG